ncbi:Para-aminobenzoate synthase OS=Streptomyces glaucescens OX=1907 GN=SGLAU_05765 PE=4 SV=1 [Streptomyces glaucescens]
MDASGPPCQHFGHAQPPTSVETADGGAARHHGHVSHPLNGLARTLRRLPPSCGPVRLVAVDGHAGSGKSTFAAELAAALGGAPVLHLDDIASHEELFDWTGPLLDQVIEPLREGTTARYAPYDWRARRFGRPGHRRRTGGPRGGRRRGPPSAAAVSGAPAVDGAAVRGVLGTGSLPGRGGAAEFWDGWVPAQRRHFAADPSAGTPTFWCAR